MTNEQIVNDLLNKNMKQEDLWNLYKYKEISLEDYQYCLNELKKSQENK